MKLQSLRSLWIGAGCIFLFCAAPLAPSPAQVAAAPAADISDPLRALPTLDANKARVFFFRPDSYVGMVANARLRINGKTVGWAGSGAAVFVDYPPGDVRVGIGGSDGYGGYDFLVTLEPGQEYFITLAAQISFGLFSCPIEGLLRSKMADQHCGNCWCAKVVDKSTALPKLQNMSISGSNPNAD